MPSWAKRGPILWARARSPEQEAVAQKILLAHGARAIEVQEINLEKRPEHVPLGSIRPDQSAWLPSLNGSAQGEAKYRTGL
jgi:hypothetical protein